MIVWVCSNCGYGIEPMFGEGGTGFRCPGTAEDCSPHKSRELLTDEQICGVPVDPLDGCWRELVLNYPTIRINWENR